MVSAPPFWPAPPRNRRLALSLTPRSYTSGTLQRRIFGRMFILQMHCRENRLESSEDSQSRRQHGPNMAMRRVHIQPCALRVRALQSCEIYYRSRDHPNAHELTNHIRHPSPAPGLRSPGAPGKALRMRCVIVPVSPIGTTGSLPRILLMGTTCRIGFL